MADTKKSEAPSIELVVDGKRITVPFIATDFHGAVTSTRYGDVEVLIGGEGDKKTYTVRVGAAEWWKAEQEFKVQGDAAVVDAFKASEENALKFLKIALSRQHGDLTLEQVANLRDFHPETGPTLLDAVLRAMSFSRPERVPEGRADPKAVAVILEALAARSGS